MTVFTQREGPRPGRGTTGTRGREEGVGVRRSRTRKGKEEREPDIRGDSGYKFFLFFRIFSFSLSLFSLLKSSVFVSLPSLSSRVELRLRPLPFLYLRGTWGSSFWSGCGTKNRSLWVTPEDWGS